MKLKEKKNTTTITKQPSRKLLIHSLNTKIRKKSTEISSKHTKENFFFPDSTYEVTEITPQNVRDQS